MLHRHRRVIRSLLWSSILGSTIASASAGAAETSDAELGRAIYTNCASCHGASGEGAFGPPLAHDENLKNTDYVTTHILTGSANMPAFRDQLSAQEIAAVINHIRNSWGNEATMISAADVKSGH